MAGRRLEVVLVFDIRWHRRNLVRDLPQLDIAAVEPLNTWEGDRSRRNRNVRSRVRLRVVSGSHDALGAGDRQMSHCR
jgi:hypothetical protein